MNFTFKGKVLELKYLKPHRSNETDMWASFLCEENKEFFLLLDKKKLLATEYNKISLNSMTEIVSILTLF